MTTTRIYVPRDAAAVSVGADEVAARIEHEAGARGLDVTVVRNGSRGMLYLEPLVEVVVNDARLAFGPVTVDDVPGLFDAGFLQGGAHPKALGKTEEIPYFAKQDRVTFARCGVIDPLDPEDYAAHGGTTGLRKALQMDAEAICQQVLDSGLRGRGGAGFPTGIKWQTVRNAEADQKYICCNADEGDSGTFADRMLMEGDPFTLIEGMTIAGLAVGATQGYVYIRSEYPDAMATMRKAIELGYALGWLGSSILDSGKDFHLDVRVGAGAYICGEETSMLESLEGKRGQVRAKPPIPALAGLFGKPTIVNNVLSLAAVPDIIADGAAAYQAYGVGRSRGTQAFQLAGNIARGGLVEKAFGISLNELIHGFGGGTYNGRPVRTVQIGGPLGAYVPADKFDLAADYETLAGNGAMLGHGGIVVFDDTVDMAQQARFALEFCAAESCGKCTPCRIGSVRGVETIDRILAGDKPDENLELLLDLCEVMTDGSLCAMGGLTPMPVRSAVQHFPEDFQRDNPPGASTSSSARVTN
ncbi:MAG: formate dehydrogenase [Gammaproteobacteria bacterium]|nr:formate dehydrogenase [Gammaproteobacteria bacterium]